GLVDERMPVAHTHEHGERRPGTGEGILKAARLRGGQLVERRAAARHLLVVMRDRFEPWRRGAAAACDDLEKRPDLVRRRRTAEREQQHRVEGAHRRADISCTISTSAFTCSTGVCGSTPWPRLKMWPGRPPARPRMSFTRRRMCAGFVSNTAGSRLPCTATSWPTIAHAVS